MNCEHCSRSRLALESALVSAERDYALRVELESKLKESEAALAELKEADRLHANICPQHVKNVDPWVRESALIAAETQLAAMRQALEDLREACTEQYKIGRIDALAFVTAGNILSTPAEEPKKVLDLAEIQEAGIADAVKRAAEESPAEKEV